MSKLILSYEDQAARIKVLERAVIASENDVEMLKSEMKITDVGAAYDPQFERVDTLRATAKAALLALKCLDGLECAREEIEALEAALLEKQMPTKICGPNLVEILNAAGFYRKKEWVGLTGPEVDAAYKSVSDKEWAINGLADARVFFCAIETKLRGKNT